MCQRIPQMYNKSIPPAKECLKFNEEEYCNDIRKNVIKELVSVKDDFICLIDIELKEVDQLFRDIVSLADEIDTIFLETEELITLTKIKPIFVFMDEKSCKIFLDVYLHEDNQEIILNYNRIFESIAGNNLVISLRDFRGMICRLPWEQMWMAKRGVLGGEDFV